MIKILNLFLYKLRNGEYFQFMSDFKRLLQNLGAAAIHSESEFETFKTALAQLDEELRVDQGSVLTEKLQYFDTGRDSCWRAIDMRIDATLLCTIEKEVEAAKRIRRIIDLYGDVRKISYNEETAALSNLLGDLTREENAGFVATCGLNKWVTTLSDLNAAFKSTQDERDTELANKNSGNAKAVRLEIDPLYEQMVERTNAMVSLNMQTPEIEAFIKELNQKIKTVDTTIAAREGRSNSDNEATPDQPEVD